MSDAINNGGPAFPQENDATGSMAIAVIAKAIGEAK